MELAAISNISIQDFWHMTISELNIYARAFNKRLEVDRSNTVLNSLLTARWVWAKKINEKDIAAAMGIKEEDKEMTDEEMAKVVIELNKQLGGEVKYE